MQTRGSRFLRVAQWAISAVMLVLIVAEILNFHVTFEPQAIYIPPLNSLAFELCALLVSLGVLQSVIVGVHISHRHALR